MVAERSTDFVVGFPCSQAIMRRLAALNELGSQYQARFYPVMTFVVTHDLSRCWMRVIVAEFGTIVFAFAKFTH